MRSLNLATRPVRNERLPAVLFTIATVVLAAATLHHGMVLRRLWPGRSNGLKQEVENLGTEMKNLESGPMRPAIIGAPQGAEWRIIRELVDRRTFWWSELFASLEAVLPPDVRIISVSPHVHEGRYDVELVARLASPQSGLNFVKVLEDRPEFENVYPRDCGEMQGEYECRYSMRYLGQDPVGKPAAKPAAPAAPAKAEAPSGGHS
jgi:hypothetical protein